jgi:Family of unknown function (DUF5761)
MNSTTLFKVIILIIIIGLIYLAYKKDNDKNSMNHTNNHPDNDNDDNNNSLDTLSSQSSIIKDKNKNKKKKKVTFKEPYVNATTHQLGSGSMEVGGSAQYAEINPTLNNNNALPMGNSTLDNNEQTPAFSKFQKMYGIENSFSDYYCGGGSSAAIRGMQMDNTPVSLLFFSDENISRLQKKIKSEIFRMTKGTFKMDVEQDVQDLLIAMRAVFLDQAKNLSTHVVRQVKILNKQALNYILPDMMTNLKQQYAYLREISEPRKILAQPLNVNKTQRGNLPSITTLWR